MKKYILFILMIVSILACTKTLDFDDEGLANTLVFNGIIQSGDSFKASLNRSSSILSETYGNGMFAGGTIQLYENGTLLSTASNQFGQFSLTDIKPKAGANYRIVVNSENETVEAQTTIPEKANVLSLDTASIKDQNNYNYTIYKLKLKDQGGDDYYRIFTTTENLTLQINSADKVPRKYYLQKNENSILTDDPVFKSLYNNFGGETLDIGPENIYHIFPDDYFKGKEYSMQFRAYTTNFGNDYYYSNPTNPAIFQGKKNIYSRNVIHIQKLSKELYTYMKYLKLYDFYHDNPFAEPVPVYSNIKNGIGIFAGLNDEAQFSFQKTYVPYSMDTIKVEENLNGYNGGYYYH